MAMRFTLRQIEYFVAAGEEGSILLASERLNISSPSVSTAISQLEAEFGIQLFIRHHAQGLSLTSEGRRFLGESKRLMAQAAAMHGFADEMAREVRGPLAVGCLVVFAAIVLPNLRSSFEAKNSGVLWSSTFGNQALLLDKLRSAEIDVALTYDLDIPKDIAFEPLARLKAHALFAADHPLAEKRSVSLAELAGLPMILLDLPLSREYFLGLYQAAGVTPLIRERVGNYDVLRSMVANGFGYSVGNIRPLAPVAADGKKLRCVPLSDAHRPMLLGVATARESYRPKVISAFEAHCRAVIHDEAIPGMAPPLPEETGRDRALSKPLRN